MNNPPKAPAITLAPKARGIFISQLQDQIRELQGIVAELSDPASRERLKIIAHTIRGGAGFFAFHDVAESAKNVEQLIVASEAPEQSCDLGTLGDLVQELVSRSLAVVQQ